MSDWKEDSAKRRDTRHTKVSDEPVKSLTPSTKKKDTNKWCRGKVGVQHKPECRKYNEVKMNGKQYLDHWRVLVCSVCGKELETYTGYGKQEKPEWVDK